jgi:carbon monoxide dehydrogenase subunit G
MRLENSFEVEASADAAWRLLNDVPAVVPCMPGAELVEVVGDDAWKANLRVKLGPIGLQFVADITRDELDEASRRVVLTSKAREAKGRGSAEATIGSTVVDLGGRTRVDVTTDVALRGAVAQYGSGVLADVASRLTEQFAECLSAKLADAPADTDAVAPERPVAQPAAQPVGGLRLVLGALVRSLFRRR